MFRAATDCSPSSHSVDASGWIGRPRWRHDPALGGRDSAIDPPPTAHTPDVKVESVGEGYMGRRFRAKALSWSRLRFRSLRAFEAEFQPRLDPDVPGVPRRGRPTPQRHRHHHRVPARSGHEGHPIAPPGSEPRCPYGWSGHVGGERYRADASERPRTAAVRLPEQQVLRSVASVGSSDHDRKPAT
jgi:hypothetical protein